MLVGANGHLQFSHSITCTDSQARILSVRIAYQSYDVRTPSTVAQYNEADIQCGGTAAGTIGGCTIPPTDIFLELNRSQKVVLLFQFSGVSGNGLAAISNQASTKGYFVNDQLAPYPNINPSGYKSGQAVPFPEGTSFGTFQNCTGKAGTGTCAGIASNFRTNLISYYGQTAGYTIPGTVANFDAHHILPKQWGGPNNVTNGVLVTNGASTNDHRRFTNWWCQFSLSGSYVASPNTVCPTAADDNS